MTAFADSAGHYTIVGVRPSLYTVRAEGLAADVYGEQSFQVTAATKDLTIDFATAGVNSIEGVVRDAYGSPMGNVNVYVGTNSAPYSLATTTDVNGHYFFDGLQPDSFTISLDRPGYTQPLGDQTVVVPDTGAKAPPVVADMSLARNHWIFGYILDPDGKPVPNGFITNAISASYYVPYVADSDGGFVITSEYAQSQLVAENADYAASLLLPTDLSTNDVIANLQLRPLSDATIPAAPSAQVYGGVESIFVSGFPTTDGGNLITKVTATVSPGGRSCSLLLTSCTITGLKDDTVYKVTIYATNKIGTGIPLVLTVRTKPIDIPRYILSHRGKNGAAVIVFKAPGRPGAIKNYTLRYIDRGKWKIYKHKPWTHSPITVSGLKARTTFTGTLQAIPKVGKSARSGPFYFTTG
jgi:protocatechuate 3,4-dioxygenase beta subunit